MMTEDIYLKIHDQLGQRSFITLEEAESICNSYQGYSWIKDNNFIFLKSNRNFSEYLNLPSPEMIVGKTDLDFNFASTGHTGYDFRLIDQCVMKGARYHKKIELIITSSGDHLLILVTKVCILCVKHKPIAVLGIAQPLTPSQIVTLNGLATLAPACSWTTELTPYPLTNAELHVQIMRNKLKLSSEEIAIIRNTSKHTVDTQLQHIRAKLYGNLNYYPDFGEKFTILPRM
jgi:DNA-binding CsgD family transcriptional regulator